jgi:D-alanyl-D-alanine carboxypeptidase
MRGLEMKFLTLLFAILFLFCQKADSQRNDAAEWQQFLEQARKDAGAPGAILALDSGNEQRMFASGLADRETRVKLKPDTPYFIGSATKMYTAVVILRLIEEKRLSMDDTLAKFLPTFPDGSKITIHHLLSQTSGLKDFYLYLYMRPDRDQMIDYVTKRWTQAELIELSGRFGRWFDPGTDWDYSSTNYFLLGIIAEKVSGMSLTDCYSHYIYQPLGIQKTWLHQQEKALGSVPTGYMGKTEAWKHSEMFGDLGPTTVLDQSSVELAAGGLIAPAAEAILFLRGLFEGKLLMADSLKAMMQFRDIPPLGYSQSKNTKDGYGLGLVRMEIAGVTLLGHGGMYNGHSAGLWYIHEMKIAITLYTNRAFVDQRTILEKLISLRLTHRRDR